MSPRSGENPNRLDDLHYDIRAIQGALDYLT